MTVILIRAEDVTIEWVPITPIIASWVRQFNKAACYRKHFYVIN